MFDSIKSGIRRGVNAVKAKAVQAYEKSKEVVTGLVAGTASLLGLTQPESAHAAGPDLTAVTSAVDFGTVTTAILGVAAAVVVVYLAWKGAKMVIAAVRGA